MQEVLKLPLYKLPELHAPLMEREAYRDRVHISRGYLRPFWKVTSQGWRPTHDVPGMPDEYSR